MKYSTLNNDPNLDIIDNIIIDIVKQREGCKLLELAIGLSEVLKNENLTSVKFRNHEEYSKLIALIQKPLKEQTDIVFDKLNNLIKTGNLVGLSYTLKNNPNADKIFILPKGTGFTYTKNKTVS